MLIINGDQADFNSIITRIRENDPSLEQYLAFMSLSKVQIIQFAESLKENQFINNLLLNNSQIEDEGEVALYEALKENQAIKVLYLCNNLIEDEGAEALSEALKINQSIMVLSLDNNLIGDKGAEALSEALKKDQFIHLFLGHNQIGDKGAKSLSEALKINQFIEKLYLNGNQIKDEGAEALAEALKINQFILMLDLDDNLIGNEGVVALAEALKKNEFIIALSLDSNQIGDKGVVALAEALKKNESVKALSLNSNQIGDEGVVALAEALKVNQYINILSLGNNQIGDEGVVALAEALKVNQSIDILTLDDNLIGSEGAIALAEALKKNESIKALHLYNNLIGNEGAIALAEALKTNQSITELDLKANEIGNEGAIALAEALKKNQSITELDLRANEIGNEGAIALAEALEKNYIITDFKGLETDEKILSIIERNINILRKAAEKFSQGQALSRVERESLTSHANSNSDISLEIFPQEQRELFKKQLEESYTQMVSTHTESMPYLAPSTPIDMNNYIIARIYHNADNYFAGLKPTDMKESGNTENAEEIRVNLADMIMQASASGIEKQLKDRHNIVFIHDALEKGMKMSEMRDNLLKIIKDPSTMDLVRKDPAILGALVTYKSNIPNNDINRIIDIINHDAFKTYINNNPREIAQIFKLNDPEHLLAAAEEIRKNPQIQSLRNIADQLKLVNKNYNTIESTAGKKKDYSDRDPWTKEKFSRY